MTDRDCFTDETTVLSRPPWGTHACLVYRSRHDLIDTLVPYFQSGLEQNACCVWITAEPLQTGEAKKVLARSVKGLDRHLKRGRIEILDAREWYRRDGGFSCSAAFHGCVRKGLEAQERGYKGLFISGNVSWLTVAEWNVFMEYEAMVNRAIENSRIAAVCAYPLDVCGARELLEIASTHQLAVIRQDGAWRRIALAGEAAPPDEEKRWVIGQIEANIEQFATLGDRIRHPLQVLVAIADLIENEQSDVIRQQAREIDAVVRQLDSGWAGSRGVREYLMKHDLAGRDPAQVTKPGPCPHPSGYPDSHRNS
ncbi:MULTISPECIES: MEDS domain-containing protein [unclassified Methanoculleus]|uniref:MEDS domain-containing protein n=1 Tax=unclassified Methanoculleus TaxID=2619537 RepID=UPI0025FA2DD3|nr:MULTISPECIES: MEDS domain-containing protein [unclassified Methanoculleus]